MNFSRYWANPLLCLPSRAWGGGGGAFKKQEGGEDKRRGGGEL